MQMINLKQAKIILQIQLKKTKVIMRKLLKIYIKIRKIKSCYKMFNFKFKIIIIIIIFNSKNQKSYQSFLIFKI